MENVWEREGKEVEQIGHCCNIAGVRQFERRPGHDPRRLV